MVTDPSTEQPRINITIDIDRIEILSTSNSFALVKNWVDLRIPINRVNKNFPLFQTQTQTQLQNNI